MKNIHPLNGNRQGTRVKTARVSKTNVFAKAGLFALLLATGCLLFLSGCRNVLQAPETGVGTLSLTIDREGVERTILPDIGLGDFARFELEFTQHHTGNIVTESWTPTSIAGGSGRVELSAGTWNLHVSAFKDNVGEPMAEGHLDGIVVPAGGIVAGNVLLSPIGSGTGTFSWDLSFPDDTHHARMSIYRVYPWGGTSHLETFFFVDYWGNNPITTQRSTSLPVGQYRVVFTLNHNQWGSTGLSAILHIYQDMESHFKYEFTDEYFPLPVLNSILAAWDGSSWNFAERGIEAGHFSIAGINGVNDGNFSDIVHWFNVLQYAVGWDPTCCCHLRWLTDAALIGIASEDANFLDANNYGHRAAAEIAIAELVRNDNTPWFSWADYRTVTVNINSHIVVFTFSADIGLPLEPQPGDSLADWFAWLRFFAQSGETYNIVIGRNECISPLQAALPNNVSGFTISISGSVPSTVSLDRSGSLFTGGSNVTLVLGNNITLQGRDGNNAPLVRVHNHNTLVMNAGAKITGNTNTYHNWSGGGVLVQGGTFTMNAGTISNNSTVGNGGGVFVDNWSTFNMRGGTIYGNNASSNGGGVLVGWEGTFNIYNGIIHGINAAASLSNTANNGAALAVFDNGIARYGIFYNDDGFYPLGYLHTMGLTVEVIDGVFQMPQREGGVAAQLAWLRYFAEDDTYTIYVSDDEDVVPQSLSFGGRDITITLSGIGQRTINIASYGSLFTVGYGVTLVLDNNITLQGRDGNTSVLVRVDHGGTLVMNEGARIVDNANTNTSCCCNRGGGVRVNDGGTFTMYGGVISGNVSNNGWTPDAGGVLSFGVFNMRGGVISGNASTWGSSRGGGVHNSGNFFMSNGVIYGVDAPEDLRNTVAEWWHSAALQNWGAAQYGTFSNGNFYQAGDLYSTNYTIRVVNGIRPPGYLTISIADFQEIGTHIPSDLPVSILHGTSATVTVLDPGQFDSITWFFGTDHLYCCCRGWPVSGSYGETLTINSNTSGNRLGRHSVTVEVRMGGVLYSKRIAFTVVP